MWNFLSQVPCRARRPLPDSPDPSTPAKPTSRRTDILFYLGVYYLRVTIFPLKSHQLRSDGISVLRLGTGLVVTRMKFTWLVAYVSVTYLSECWN